MARRSAPGPPAHQLFGAVNAALALAAATAAWFLASFVGYLAAWFK